MRNNLAPRGVGMERVENMVGGGTPDMHAVCAGVMTWCELKEVEQLPVRATTPLLGNKGLRTEQRNWHLWYVQRGGRVVTIVGAQKEVLLVEGRYSDELNSMPLQRIRQVAAATGWNEIGTYLGAKN